MSFLGRVCFFLLLLFSFNFQDHEFCVNCDNDRPSQYGSIPAVVSQPEHAYTSIPANFKGKELVDESDPTREYSTVPFGEVSI